MDLKKLKQQWKKEDDMHPSIEFDNEKIKTALKQQHRETRYAWILPLLLLAGLILVFFLTGVPEVMTARFILYSLGVGALGIYCIYSLWTYYRDTKSIPVAEHLKRLKRRSRWLEQFYGAVALALASLSVIAAIFSDKSISELVQDSYLLWLYVLVFAILYFRKRRNRIDVDSGDISWENLSVTENQKAVQRYMWVLPLTAGAATLVVMLYLFGYNSDWMLGLFFGLLFVLISGLYDYFKRK